jgi:amino acid transporter
MAPTAAMALNGVFAAQATGSAVPLSFILAMMAIASVAFSFIHLTRHFAHSGSVYAFNGVTLGARVGFFSGWALLGTYFCFAAGSIAEIGNFVQPLIADLGATVNWLPISLCAGLLVWVLAYNSITVSTRFVLIMEAISLLLIAVLTAVILVKVGNSGRLTATPFTPSGHSWGAVAQGAVFGFLAFAGFEGAATLGEEARNPRRTVPLALGAAVLVTGLIYVVNMYAQTVGFGVDARGTAAYAGSNAPLSDLGRRYVGTAMGTAVDVAAAISAFAGALGAANAGARMLFAMGRDGFIAARLGTVSARTQAPATALTAIMVAGLTTVLIWSRDPGVDGAAMIGYLGTLGTFTLLVAYALTAIGAMRFFGARRLWTWQHAIPAFSVLALGYTLYSNIYPVPIAPYNIFPYVALAWLLIGAAIVLASPALEARIGLRLSDLESPLGTETQIAR